MVLASYWKAISGLFVLAAALNVGRCVRWDRVRGPVRLAMAGASLAWAVCSYSVGQGGIASAAWPAGAACALMAGAALLAARLGSGTE